jgi:hypothetical protein
MNILVLFQVGNLDILYDTLKYIQDFTINYNVFFIFSLLDSFKSQEKEFIDNLVKFNVKKYHFMYHINKGMDIGPYLKQLNYVFANYTIDSFDTIFKIHTKTDKKWREELIDCLNTTKYNKWEMPLDKLNVLHINEICNKFNIKNIFYDEISNIDYELITEKDIDISFYCNYYNIKLENCDSLSTLIGYDVNRNYIYTHLKNNLNIPNESYIIKKTRNPNLTFIAGTIFSIKYKYVWDFFSKININEIYNLLEEGYTINNKSTYVHAMERILSGFVYLY